MTNEEREDLEFEVEFLEAVVERSPDFEEPLMALGFAYTQLKQYKKGLGIDRRLLELRPYDKIVYYNLACSLSLLRDIDASFDALETAVDLGYANFDDMLQDADLENVRKDPRFPQIILSKIKP